MNETTEQPICPHVVTSREGTSYCRLAESSVAALTKERDELLAKLFDVRVQRDLLLVDAARLDWLDSHGRMVKLGAGFRGTPDSWTWQDSQHNHQDAASLRTAIDAARHDEVSESMRQAPVD